MPTLPPPPPPTPAPMPMPTHVGKPPQGGPVGKPQPPAGPTKMGPDEVAAKLAAQLPTPDRGYYSYTVVDKLAKATNAALHKVLAHHAPDGGFPDVVCPPSEGGKVNGKLPLSVIAPALILIDVVTTTAGDAGARYHVDLAELATDDGVRDLTAKLNMLAADKKVQKIIDGHMMPGHAEPEGDESASGAEPPGPEEKGPMTPPPGVGSYM